jgi:hypothetical protein
LSTKDDPHWQRKCQLVAREGMLREILDVYPFPTDNHRKVIELLYDETIEACVDIGMQPLEVFEAKEEVDGEGSGS